MKHIIVQYGLQYTTGLDKGKLVGLDHNSGNYPYPCHSISHAWLLPEQDLLIKYRDKFSQDKFQLVTLTTVIEDVK